MRNLFKSEIQLLIGRFLTRSGDQAWDFVVPFALLHVFPGKIQIAALYYFIIKLGSFLLTPSVGKWIDSNQRLKVVKIGVALQFFAVLCGALIFYFLAELVHKNSHQLVSDGVLLLFAMLALMGVVASVGTLITDISVGSDVVPALVPPAKLTEFNSWLRRIDLGTEVCVPVVVGVLMTLESSQTQLLGILCVALWNLVSFIPEYFLLQNVIKKAGLQLKEINAVKSWKELFQFNLRESVSNPLFWLIFSYALLWLSVLSPHGVLLVGYLNDKMKLPETELGIFRGLGAIFGLLSTLTFPYFVQRYGLFKSSKLHLGFQGVTLVAGLAAFMVGSSVSIYIFLAFILLSRIGLYGFSNGEFELRQRLIPESKRGEINSLSSLMTTLATLVLFGAGSLLPSTADFKYLVYASVGAVLVANVVFFKWAKGSST